MSNFTPQVKRVDKNLAEELMLAFAMAKEKRFDEALWSFKTILQSNPTAKLAHLGAGNMLFRQKRYDEALIHYQEVMRLDPLMVRAPLAAGRIYIRQGNWEKATELFQDALNIDPTSSEAHMGLGRALMSQKKDNEAIQQFRNALRLDPQLIPARLLVAQIYENQGNLANTVSELRSALKIDPTRWRIHQYLGRIYLQQSEYGAARDAFQEALKFEPEFPHAARLGLIEALIAENHLEEATENLQQVPQYKPLDAKKHQLWGDIYQRQGLLKEATQEYRAATLLAAEKGDTLEELVDLDAILEQDEDRWQEVLEPYKAAANRRVSEAQNRRRTNLQERSQRS
jgi:tetratricopeptide (TPR) repeat protein